MITVGLTELMNEERVSMEVMSHSFSSGAMTVLPRFVRSFANCLPSCPLAPRMRYVLEGFSFFLSSGVLARFTGISDNPNFVGLVTMISTILILSFLHLKRFSSKTYKSVFYMLLINNFFIFLIIASRAAVIGTILGSVFLLFFINKKLLRTTLIIGISTIIVLFLITPVRDFLLIVIRLEDFSIREYLWTAGIEIFNDNLLTGIGPSTFRIEFYSYIPSSIITFFNMRFDLSEKNPHPHNFFLLMGAENGILGLNKPKPKTGNPQQYFQLLPGFDSITTSQKGILVHGA